MPKREPKPLAAAPCYVYAVIETCNSRDGNLRIYCELPGGHAGAHRAVVGYGIRMEWDS